MGLKDTDSLELLDRFNFLVSKYVPLAVELAPKLEEFGRYRKELQLIVVELTTRGLKPDEPEEFKKLLENLLEKRRTEEQNGSQSDPST